MSNKAMKFRSSINIQDRIDVDSANSKISFYEKDGEMYLECRKYDADHNYVTKNVKVFDLIDLLDRFNKLEAEMILIGEHNG